VPLAQHEQVLAAARRVGDVDVHEAAVIERDQWNRCRKRAAGVQALVNRVAALLDTAKPNVGVLDRQEVKTAASQEVLGGGSGRPNDAVATQNRVGIHRESTEIDNRATG
jgi:hypothetical protein